MFYNIGHRRNNFFVSVGSLFKRRKSFIMCGSEMSFFKYDTRFSEQNIIQRFSWKKPQMASPETTHLQGKYHCTADLRFYSYLLVFIWLLMLKITYLLFGQIQPFQTVDRRNSDNSPVSYYSWVSHYSHQFAALIKFPSTFYVTIEIRLVFDSKVFIKHYSQMVRLIKINCSN